MAVVVHTKLVGDRQEQRIGLRDGFVFRELIDTQRRSRSIAGGRRTPIARDCGEGLQCPKERKPIFFIGAD